MNITTKVPPLAIAIFSAGMLLSGLPHALGQVPNIKKVGNPSWEPVDFHIFAAPVGTFKDDFAEFGQTMQALLPPPNHQPCADLGIGPGDRHLPPYDSELAEGVKINMFVEKTTFHVSEFSFPRGIWAVWMTVPSAGSPTGSSPDFPIGPIIPNSLFPITVEEVTLRDGDDFAKTSLFVPPLTDDLSCPFDVDGHSHFPIFFFDAKEFGPKHINPAGVYDYRVEMRDHCNFDCTLCSIDGNGWDISAQFQVTPKKPK